MPIERSELERIMRSEAFADRHSPERRERLPAIRFHHVMYTLLLGALFLILLPLIVISYVVFALVNNPEMGFKLPDALFCYVPVLFPTLLFAFLALVIYLPYRKFRDAPIEAEVALVVSKHQQQKSRRVTLEFADGSREEFEVGLGFGGQQIKMYAHLGIGDLGIAFLQINQLLDFERV